MNFSDFLQISHHWTLVWIWRNIYIITFILGTSLYTFLTIIISTYKFIKIIANYFKETCIDLYLLQKHFVRPISIKCFNQKMLSTFILMFLISGCYYCLKVSSTEQIIFHYSYQNPILWECTAWDDRQDVLLCLPRPHSSWHTDRNHSTLGTYTCDPENFPSCRSHSLLLKQM